MPSSLTGISQYKTNPSFFSKLYETAHLALLASTEKASLLFNCQNDKDLKLQ